MSYDYGFLSANPNNAFRYHSYENERSNKRKFDRDRDRILFSKEFRRLQGKTQVFVSGFDDHVRNRLTHTIIVNQIAQTLCRSFNLNLELAEAIALGHDVGHTPFGHVGERTLNSITNGCDVIKENNVVSNQNKGFKHNFQGIKVLTSLESISESYSGLNLTDYTLWGVLNHTGLKYKKCENFSDSKCTLKNLCRTCINNQGQYSLDHYESNKYFFKNSWTLEALFVKQADEIAQRFHDIEDGLLAGIIDKQNLINEFKKGFDTLLDRKTILKINKIGNIKNNNFFLHDFSTFIISLYSNNLLSSSAEIINKNIKNYDINAKNFNNIKSEINNFNDFVNFSPEFSKCDEYFKDYVYNNIVNSHVSQSMDGKSTYILKKIISAYLTNPMQLPDSTLKTIYKSYSLKNDEKIEELPFGNIRNKINNLFKENNNQVFKDVLLRTIVDFIAGMTDSFAIYQYNLLYKGDKFSNYSI